MIQENVSLEIEKVLQLVRDEIARINVQGRMLQPQETAFLKRLSDAVQYLQNASSALKEETSQETVSDDVLKIPEGRYVGGNNELHIDLRIDAGQCGVISADLYRTDSGAKNYVASIRTAPGSRIELKERTWTIIGQDELGARATGKLEITTTSIENTLSGSLLLNGALQGLPSRIKIPFILSWTSEYFRTIGLEIEMEERVDEPKPYSFNGQEVSLESALMKAGINVIDVGLRSRIPVPSELWGETQLHTLMQDFAESSLMTRSWELRLLLLSRSNRDGLLGVMFDTSEVLPRQGAAVFLGEIRKRFLNQTDRKVIQTIVHELGHAMNLAHRFERVVGRADSSSFMNYDWRYQGGNHTNDFWSKFNFSFDPDELEFLRHSALPGMIPGGSAFHSVNYWADGNGGYSPYVPEVSMTEYKLELIPPTAGRVFEFGQPVLLQVKLTNVSAKTLQTPMSFLDPKTGYLEILIRRRQTSTVTDLENAKVFVPIVQRCFDISSDEVKILKTNESLSSNLNLTYGSGGFSFAEPGDYEVIALVAIYDQKLGRDFIVRSQPLWIRVGVPKSTDEERQAMTLLRKDVGLFLALGGTDGLKKAEEALMELQSERAKKHKRKVDPIGVNIRRSTGMKVKRPYLRFKDNRFLVTPSNEEKAAQLLGNLTQQELNVFDPQTAADTKKLADELKKKIGPRKKR